MKKKTLALVFVIIGSLSCFGDSELIRNTDHALEALSKRNYYALTEISTDRLKRVFSERHFNEMAELLHNLGALKKRTLIKREVFAGGKEAGLFALSFDKQTVHLRVKIRNKKLAGVFLEGKAIKELIAKRNRKVSAEKFVLLQDKKEKKRFDVNKPIFINATFKGMKKNNKGEMLVTMNLRLRRGKSVVYSKNNYLEISGVHREKGSVEGFFFAPTGELLLDLVLHDHYDPNATAVIISKKIRVDGVVNEKAQKDYFKREQSTPLKKDPEPVKVDPNKPTFDRPIRRNDKSDGLSGGGGPRMIKAINVNKRSE